MQKFDAVTRYRVKDGGLSFFSDIALLLIDEVHLLNDPRGAALEAIVSRIKMLARNPEMKSTTLACVRFLAVSATIPNICDLGNFQMIFIPVHHTRHCDDNVAIGPLNFRVLKFNYHPNGFNFCSWMAYGSYPRNQKVHPDIFHWDNLLFFNPWC